MLVQECCDIRFGNHIYLGAVLILSVRCLDSVGDGHLVCNRRVEERCVGAHFFHLGDKEGNQCSDSTSAPCRIAISGTSIVLNSSVVRTALVLPGVLAVLVLPQPENRNVILADTAITVFSMFFLIFYFS